MKLKLWNFKANRILIFCREPILYFRAIIIATVLLIKAIACAELHVLAIITFKGDCKKAVLTSGAFLIAARTIFQAI